MKKFFILAVVAIATMFNVSVALAEKEIETEVVVKDNVIFIRGNIVSSTHETFAVLLTQTMLETNESIIVDLNSRGGDVDAALDIVKQIEGVSEYVPIETRITAGNSCSSACPLIFFATEEHKLVDDSYMLFHAPIKKSKMQNIDTQSEEYKKEFKEIVKQYLAVISKRAPELAEFLKDEEIILGKHGDVVLTGDKLNKFLAK